MKNRLVRWSIYLAIGVLIGVGVNYFQQKEKDDDVVALSPDEAQQTDLELPNRDIALDDEAMETIPSLDGFVEDAKDAGSTLRDAADAAMQEMGDIGETLSEGAQEAVDSLPASDEESKTSEDPMEETEGTEESALEEDEPVSNTLDNIAPEAGVVEPDHSSSEQSNENHSVVEKSIESNEIQSKNMSVLTPMPE
ncbi:MAG: hypothetical protein ACLFP8_08275 [Alphaproteobacteria bacterium]